jgi:hypothetical protein
VGKVQNQTEKRGQKAWVVERWSVVGAPLRYPCMYVERELVVSRDFTYSLAGLRVNLLPTRHRLTKQALLSVPLLPTALKYTLQLFLRVVPSAVKWQRHVTILPPSLAASTCCLPDTDYLNTPLSQSLHFPGLLSIQVKQSSNRLYMSCPASSCAMFVPSRSSKT